MELEAYDVIVVGAGHAGCEAALASARLGARTLLLTIHLDTIAQMSCNPSIGGLAKGQLVREIDALGGAMGKITDQTGIHFRMLGTSKGPAVRGLRAQADKMAYHIKMKQLLESTPNLFLRQEMVHGVIAEKIKDSSGTYTHDIKGIDTISGNVYRADKVILTTGTFLKGLVHIGLNHYSSGRGGEPSAEFLSESLVQLGFKIGRLKTGTPSRLNGRSIDFSKLGIQPGDPEPSTFSFSTEKILQPQVLCYITYTQRETHEIIKKSLDRSPLYSGVIKGIGPRYCPSIEDKVVKFAGKDRHQIFIEPEGRDTLEYYPNGISTSLPPDVQLAIVHSLPGLEKAEIMRWAYGIEYDFVFPTQVYSTLESKLVHGLYLAGQINGTTGYEEAAALGLMAGINAVRSLKDLPAVVIPRDQGYIGVLIDDLVTLGVNEPYRMFSSRAEYRLLLRHDNADRRLMPLGYEIGLADKASFDRLQKKEQEISVIKDTLEKIHQGPFPLTKILRRPEIKWKNLEEMDSRVKALSVSPGAIEQVEIEVKYEGYIERQFAEIKRFKKSENIMIPPDFNFLALSYLKKEAREKLEKHRPTTIGQASRIPGVTPSDISVLMIYLSRDLKQTEEEEG